MSISFIPSIQFSFEDVLSDSDYRMVFPKIDIDINMLIFGRFSWSHPGRHLITVNGPLTAQE